MEFRRYDGIFNGAPQKKIDSELPVCPFCGEYPHWNLNVRNGFSANITCMCEKCKGKLYTEYYGMLNMDNLRVVDLGEKNIHNLSLNGTYNILSLNSLAKTTPKISENKDDFKNGRPQIAITAENNEQNNKKRMTVILSVILFIVAFFVLVWILVPKNRQGSIDDNSNNKLELVTKSNMKVNEVSGYYYVTITGSARNTSNYKFEYVGITFTLYDSGGNVVGTAIDNQLDLGAGETWLYSASGISTTTRPVTYKVTGITYY